MIFKFHSWSQCLYLNGAEPGNFRRLFNHICDVIGLRLKFLEQQDQKTWRLEHAFDAVFLLLMCCNMHYRSFRNALSKWWTFNYPRDNPNLQHWWLNNCLFICSWSWFKQQSSRWHYILELLHRGIEHYIRTLYPMGILRCIGTLHYICGECHHLLASSILRKSFDYNTSQILQEISLPSLSGKLNIVHYLVMEEGLMG